MPETYRLCDKKNTALTALIKRVALAKRVAVVTGAGISVNCGIPDFRSSEGIFQQIQAAHGDTLASGRDLFDASVVFRSAATADIFYRWMTHLRRKCAEAQPGVVHRFIRQLADRGTLLRSYTQNIDGLERKAGLTVWDPYAPKSSDDHVPWQSAQSVPLHGSMDRLTCHLCSSSLHFPEHSRGAIVAGDECPDCRLRSDARQADGRRSLPTGKLRPTVVLYEEPHPHCEDIAKIIAHDTRALGSRRAPPASTLHGSSRVTKPREPQNVIMVFGTTLKVPGCRQLVRQLANASPASTITVFINNEPVCGKSWDGIVDYQVIGDVDAWCLRIQRQWSMQPKITRWAKTRKTTTPEVRAPTQKKPQRMTANKENADTAPAAASSNEKCQTSSRKRKCLDVCDDGLLPTRRSVRIAERESLDLYRQSSPHAIYICI
ncbi:NAD-dependent deacetylase hst3 [Coemansia sp. RSA 1813]|nr:NAD-dependent deacetylase hst3 [Coemansia sp. RSA 1646]KAJ1774048.1 NAD-dependent deacetylase hst3 [Coemansia sp. RSA 1843]KAJ2092562.1 NAD-dependent deacetylase hst3 [Coemansia sp. RSA 986]KAJ2216744.1 NAD-dependent deacetylase hst3 [Coemansia sp. RSA 487]KAJ2572816.1 NAD-dependent deacetylase hst3 [Coemansia sp. RSA 1813]